VYFSSGTTWASSAALTQYGVVYGGGAGAAPVATAAGTTGQFLGANTGAAPTWQTPAGGSPGGTSGQFQYNNSSAFGGASVLTYNANGPIVLTTIGVGATTPAATGAGVSFPATASGSSDVNTLDDYEEGTWTPTDQSGAGLTLTSSGTARYTKIGRLVQVQAQLAYPTTANGSVAKVGGLPFPGAVSYYPSNVPAIAAGTITSLVIVQLDSSPFTNFEPRQQLNNTAYTNAQMSGASFSFSWCYISP
jgi:hypothetical protein